MVMPNGAGEEEFSHVDPTFWQRYRISEDVPLLLTVGSHTRRVYKGLLDLGPA